MLHEPSFFYGMAYSAVFFTLVIAYIGRRGSIFTPGGMLVAALFGGSIILIVETIIAKLILMAVF